MGLKLAQRAIWKTDMTLDPFGLEDISKLITKVFHETEGFISLDGVKRKTCVIVSGNFSPETRFLDQPRARGVARRLRWVLMARSV